MAEEAIGNKTLRSPNHPFFDLKEAVAKVKIVYEKEKRSATSPEVIVKHLGYSALNGPGGRTLSGLRQYRLLEEVAGKYKLSDDAFALLHYSQESEQWKAAVRRAALAPVLYRDLLGMYPDLSASDASLRMTLLDKGFNPAVIERALGDFRSTMQFAGLPDGSYTDPEEETKMQTTPATASPTSILPIRSSAGRSYSFPLSPDLRAELILQGDPTSEDLELLRAHIDLTIKALSRAAKVAEQ
ncbi:MAG TPA: hypothetical protein VHU44_03995 [Acidobacteriaceae bacterium]|jgi:hypothetical protein|nr:hypothetical protein [Acidobacteriaceae bacterium]